MAITHAPTTGRGLIDSLRMCHRGVDGDTTLDPEVPEGKVDRMRRELQTIRNRRSKTERRRFPNGIEDYVLITGFVLGALYLALITSMSTGVFGDSVAMDEASSRTFLDIGEPCLDRSDETFILIFIDNDAETVMIEPKNLMPSDELLIEWAWDNGSRTNESVPVGYGANVLLPFNDLEEGTIRSSSVRRHGTEPTRAIARSWNWSKGPIPSTSNPQQVAPRSSRSSHGQMRRSTARLSCSRRMNPVRVGR